MTTNRHIFFDHFQLDSPANHGGSIDFPLWRTGFGESESGLRAQIGSMLDGWIDAFL